MKWHFSNRSVFPLLVSLINISVSRQVFPSWTARHSTTRLLDKFLCILGIYVCTYVCIGVQKWPGKVFAIIAASIFPFARLIFNCTYRPTGLPPYQDIIARLFYFFFFFALFLSTYFYFLVFGFFLLRAHARREKFSSRFFAENFLVMRLYYAIII